ncbi:MAG: DUF1499 domain-containing protein [Gammaproteobacteria bacterium]|nr:DUF1499 domain-containing protein [Gammaproteobacteria bacterium]
MTVAQFRARSHTSWIQSVLSDTTRLQAGETMMAQAAKSGMLAKFVLFVGLIALAALPVGALGHRFGLLDLAIGSALVFSGIVLATIVLVLGVATLIFVYTRRRRADRMPALIGLAASVVVLVVTAPYYVALSLPMTNDVTTDRDDPPVFEQVAAESAPGANLLDYTETEAQVQAEGYPDLVGVRESGGADVSFGKAVDVARALGWDVVSENAGTGLIEATATTFWFGFQDDVAIRVRREDNETVVDLRSASRVGLHDLGANAERIRAFVELWNDS